MFRQQNVGFTVRSAKHTKIQPEQKIRSTPVSPVPAASICIYSLFSVHASSPIQLPQKFFLIWLTAYAAHR